MEYAGQDISLNMQHLLLQQSIEADMNFSRLLKERMGYVTTSFSDSVKYENESNRFSLPDGTEVNVKKSLFGSCADSLFFNSSFEPAGAVPQLFDSLKLCDDSLLKDLSHHVIISGGSTMLPGFGDKILNELQLLTSKENQKFQRLVKIRVTPCSAHRFDIYSNYHYFRNYN
jgi:hypothetical protein